MPDRAVQAARREPEFQRIAAALEAQRLRLSATPDAMEPETILVLEIAGEVTDFARAMAEIPGLEFLGEQALEQVEPDDEFAVRDQNGQLRRYSRQLFLMASDARAWRQVLSMWQRWKAGIDPGRPLTPFRDLFAQLRDLREWSDYDRLERGGAAAIWRSELVALGNELVPFEAELWLRPTDARQKAEVSRLRRSLERVGGEVVTDKVIEEIDYHGVLGKAPADRLLEAANTGSVSWIATEGVRLFHATGQIVAPAGDDAQSAPSPGNLGAPPRGPTRIAILDGLPVPGHEALVSRIQIDDPDAWAEAVPVDHRSHGTLMASAVVHGDLGDGGAPLSEPVYVRPVLRPDAPAWVSNPPERLPADRLPVDFVNAAVTRLFAGDAPVAPGTRAIVLAVGDASQQFDRFVSPLARLLDYLAWKHNVLFIVSAGNHPADLLLPADTDLTDPVEVEYEVLDALRREALFRRLLAPAESINALTVGAAHDDASRATLPPGLLDPLIDPDLPSVISPVASGVNRAVKPDVLFPGGRQPLQHQPGAGDDTHRLSVAISRRPPGVRVAAPGLDGELDRYVHSKGTSPATGLAGHAAGVILRRLDELRAMYGDAFPESGLTAVLLKAALVHTARWGSASQRLEGVFRDAGLQRVRDSTARFLGFGRAHIGDALVADDHRAVVIQAGRLLKDGSHTYELPLIDSLRSAAVERRLTLTLAWLTPALPRHRAYRAAKLEVEFGAGLNAAFGVRTETESAAAGRGTLQHEVLVSRRAVPYRPGDTMPLRVSCRATTKVLDEAIPYALIATIDTPAELRLPIYQEVRAAATVRAAVPIRARA